MLDRIARLEAMCRPARSNQLTPHALERMTMAELAELEALLQGADVDDLSGEARARALAMIDAASRRTQPAPLARDEPGYDVMSETRRMYAGT
jgi:hypothetical protein